MNPRKLTQPVFSLGTECFAPRRFPLCASKTVWQYGDLIDVMLSKAKHLAFSGCYKAEILRLRLRMTLRHSLSALRYLKSFSPHRSPKIFALWVGAILTLLSAAPAPAQVRQEQAKLTNVVGQVEVLRRGTTAWQPAKAGMALSVGDEIRAAQNSGAEIAMVDGSIVMVFARSRLQIRQLTTETATQERTSWFHLVVGLVRYIVSQPAVTLVRARQNQFTISTPTAVMAARGTDGVLGYAAAAGAAPALKPGVAKPGVPAPGAAPAGGQTTLLCLGGVSALTVLPVVPGTVATGEQVFCENGQIWQVEAGRLNLLLVLPNAIRAAIEAGASPQDVQQIVESTTPVPFTWTPVEQAMFDASPFDLPTGPNETQVVQIANAALSASMPPTTIATALPPSANVQVVNFEQFVSGITTTSDVQKEPSRPTGNSGNQKFA